MTAPLDVLVVGGGPGGLAAAIRIKQQLAAASAEATVAVIDKAPRPGYHALSGASFEPAPLDELVPAWRDDRKLMEHMIPVERAETRVRTGSTASVLGPTSASQRAIASACRRSAGRQRPASCLERGRRARRCRNSSPARSSTRTPICWC